MKTTLRFQSRLLIRRSYKPAHAQRRALNISFRFAPRFGVPVSEADRNEEPAATAPRIEIALSG